MENAIYKKIHTASITIETFSHRKFLTLAAKSVSLSVLNTTSNMKSLKMQSILTNQHTVDQQIKNNSHVNFGVLNICCM